MKGLDDYIDGKLTADPDLTHEFIVEGHRQFNEWLEREGLSLEEGDTVHIKRSRFIPGDAFYVVMWLDGFDGVIFSPPMQNGEFLDGKWRVELDREVSRIETTTSSYNTLVEALKKLTRPAYG
jgi:hypothetical protein